MREHTDVADLAELAYDSVLDDHELVSGLRGESAPLRTLTFEASGLIIELGVAPDSLVGYLVPPTSGVVEVRVGADSVAAVPVNDLGCFTIRPVPTTTFSLRCRTLDGRVVVTDWFTL